MLNQSQMINKRIFTSVFAVLITVQSPAVMAKSKLKCRADLLKANYEINTQQHGEYQNQQVTLWRNKKQVAQQFHHRQISEVWYQSINNRIQLTRYFEQFSRGIEYQPVDMKTNQDNDWQQKNTFLSKAFFDSLNYQGSKDGLKGCGQVIDYEKHTDEQFVKLEWMPKLQLVKSLTIRTKKMKKTWTLLNTSHNSQNITSQFSKWSGFNTTDYADIGDSEDDPFLQKMINMGFSANHNQHQH